MRAFRQQREPREDVAYGPKQDDGEYPVNVPFDVAGLILELFPD